MTGRKPVDKHLTTRAHCARDGWSRLVDRWSAGRRLVQRSLWGVALASLLAAVVSSAPALALTQRGHVFASSFKGEGQCPLSDPVAVAVNESSHDIYVLDSQQERVERFNAEGKCISQFKTKIESPQAIAIDNSASSTSPSPSAGDVYVSSDEGHTVYKFNEAGELLHKLTKFKRPEETTAEEFEEIHGLAVDEKGDLFVYQGEETSIVGFDAASPANQQISVAEFEGCETRAGLAVAPEDQDFYVGRLLEAGAIGAEECVQEPSPPPIVIAKLNSVGAPVIRAMTKENSTGVAVDLASSEASPLGARAKGDVYVDTGAGVDAFDSRGSVIQRFGDEPGHPLTAGRGVAVDSRSGDVYVADAGEERQVEVFSPAETGPPVLDSVASHDLSTTATELEASIDPNGLDTHYYFQFGTVDCSASPASCTDLPVPAPGQDIGSSFGDVPVGVPVDSLQPSTVYYFRIVASNTSGTATSAVHSFSTLPSATGLLPDDRAWELVSPADKHGASALAMVLQGGGLAEASEDGNAITYVADSPVTAEPEDNRAPEVSQVLSVRGEKEWSSRDIDTPENESDGYDESALAEYRFFSPDLALGLAVPFTATAQNKPPLAPPVLAGEAQEATPYLRADQPLSPASGTSEEATYRLAAENSAFLAPGYLALVSAANDTASPPAKFGDRLGFLDATPDLGHVVLESEVALTASPPGEEGGLYEWSANRPPGEQIQPINVLPGPGDERSPEAQLAGHGPETAGPRAISDDGTRVFWTDAEHTHLYMRDTAPGEQKTLTIDAAHGVSEPPSGESESVHYQAASSDGSLVFFTDTETLTTDSLLRPLPGGGSANPADLYVSDLATGTLTDLTVDHNFDQDAEVLGDALGASEDGSTVYFVANGALAPRAVAGNCQGARIESSEPEAMCNLYVEHFDTADSTWEAPKLIAVLSQEDANDWNGGGPPGLSHMTARVSPNGEFLAFMSDESLTGYSTVDASPEAHGARAEEVYMYDAAHDRLICASCNPSATPPTGIFDGEHANILADRLGVWPNRWLAGSIPGWTPVTISAEDISLYQSRYLSNRGRLFFDSPEHLVSQPSLAVNGKENVYEYEPDGVGGCSQSGGCVALISSGTSERESVFLDASAEGNDVFFLTAQPLVAAVQETTYSVYDARVCTSGSPCLTSESVSPRPCEGEPSVDSCRGAPSAQPAASGPPPSETLPPPPRLTSPRPKPPVPKPLTRAQKLAKALEACKKHYKKGKRRSACERAARRKYRPPSKRARRKR